MKEVIVYKRVDELKGNPKNPRKNDGAVDGVMKSIEKYGFRNPLIIDENNVVWCGNTRLKAAIKLGLEEAPCIVVKDLTKKQMEEYALLDNKTSEVAEWDYDILSEILPNVDLSDFDFVWIESEKPEVVKPELEFTEILGEEHNYIVLYFDNEVDWLQAETLFDIKEKRLPSTRKDGKITKSMERKSIGRVLNGRKALNKLMGGAISEDKY